MTVTLEVDFVPYYCTYRTIIDLDEENLNHKSVFLWGPRVMRKYMVLGSVPYTGAFTRNLGVGILRVVSHPDPLLHRPPTQRDE